MKIRTLILTALASSALAAPAFAVPALGSNQGTVDIYGHVEDRCRMTLSNDFIDLGELTNEDGTLNPAVATGQSATLQGWCNGTAADISVEAFPITNEDFTTAPPAGFQRIVNYTATASVTGTAGTATPSDASDSAGTSGPGASEAVGIFNDDITVTLASLSTPAAGKLVAGDYHGLVVVTLTPNVSFGETND